MTDAATQSTTPPVSTGTGPVNTLAGWLAEGGVSISPEAKALFLRLFGVVSDQFMDKATLFARIDALPLVPPPPDPPEPPIVGTKTLSEWAALLPRVAAIVVRFLQFYGEAVASQLMDRGTLNLRIRALPPA